MTLSKPFLLDNTTITEKKTGPSFGSFEKEELLSFSPELHIGDFFPRNVFSPLCQALTISFLPEHLQVLFPLPFTRAACHVHV